MLVVDSMLLGNAYDTTMLSEVCAFLNSSTGGNCLAEAEAKLNQVIEAKAVEAYNATLARFDFYAQKARCDALVGGLADIVDQAELERNATLQKMLERKKALLAKASSLTPSELRLAVKNFK